jgi:glycosyltransferase involved in cell wall biosynthesis
MKQSALVVVSHPHKQHSYRVALALHQAALLQRFVTGIYYKPNKWPYSLNKWLPKAARNKVLQEFEKRRIKELPETLVGSWYGLELLARLIEKISILHKLLDWHNRSHDLLFSYWLRLQKVKPTIIYTFLGASQFTLKTAKELGIVTVLDVPSLIHHLAIVASEQQQLGLNTRESPSFYNCIREAELATYIIAPSEAVIASLVQVGISPTKILLLPFGVDIARFSPNYSKLDTTVAPKTFKALFVGKFGIGKGLHYILEAWQNLNLPNAELLIVGPAVEIEFVKLMHNKYTGSFKEYGNLTHAELAQVYREADIFVFTSLSEGSALVTYEALASGLPCIVSSESGSVIRDGVEGFIVPTKNVKAVATAIQTLYTDPALRQSMAKAARQRAKEFTWERYNKHLTTLIQEICTAQLKTGDS